MLAHETGKLHVEVRIGRHLDVEVVVAALAAGVDEAGHLVQAARVEGPAQGQGLAARPTPHLREGAAAELAGEVVQRQVDPGPRDGHAGGEARGHGAIHGLVRALDVQGIGAQERRREVLAQHEGRGLQGLVAPLGDGDALTPAHPAAVGRDLHHDRRPTLRAVGTREELEVARHRVAQGEDLDALDPGRGAGPRGRGRAGEGEGGGRGGRLQESAAIETLRSGCHGCWTSGWNGPWRGKNGRGYECWDTVFAHLPESRTVAGLSP